MNNLNKENNMNKLFCKLKLHRWTEDNDLSRLMMVGNTGYAFGCTRCGCVKKTKHSEILPLGVATSKESWLL